MLVLSRHRNEWIIIGDTIALAVVAIRGSCVRLGFHAPPEIPIHLEEEASDNSIAASPPAASIVTPARFTASSALFDLEHLRIFSRMRDQQVRIGSNIVVTIVDIRGDKVRLGLEAPREISLHRREVYEAIQRDQRGQSQ